jgi:fibronectin-binding autotransporter adhesin
LQGVTASALLNFNINSSSTVVLAGNTTASTNLGTITVNGGTLRLDNSSVANSNRLSSGSSNTVTLNGGGALEVYGNASTSVTQNIGPVATGNTIGGVNTIRVVPNGSATTLNIGNTSGSLQPGRAVWVFESTSGNLGDSSGAKITLATTPNLGAGNLLSANNAANSTTVGFAIVKDGLGTNWATWTASTGIVSVANSSSGVSITTVTDTTGVGALNGNGVVAQFNPAASSTTSAAGTVTAASLRITPAGAGATLAMGSNALKTSALMLDGTNDFAITGTGNFGNSGSNRNIYVNSQSTTLSMSLVFNGSAVFAGPGFLDMTGVGAQLTTSNRLIVAGGTVRASNTQVGLTLAGAGILSFGGGVLEIKNGSNGTGASADFTRSLGTGNGNVTWGTNTTTDGQGGGGFSAFGAAASVNIGGSSTPATLQWNTTNFVGDGLALIFGSTKSNATLNFLNGLQLDNGSAYQLREIKVIGGTGSDKTVLAGAISGSSAADLIKTGTGTLVMSANNTYNGNTFVAGGTLAVNGTNSGSGAVTVWNGGTLKGTGTIAGNSTAGAIVVNNGGTLAPGDISTTGILTVNNAVTLQSGSTFSARVNGATAGTQYDQLLVTSGTVTLAGSLSLSGGYSPNSSDVIFLVNNTGTGALSGTFSNYADGSTVAVGGFNWKIYYGASANAHGGTNGNDVVLVPVPEPGSILFACAAIGGGYYGIRRWRRRPTTS